MGNGNYLIWKVLIWTNITDRWKPKDQVINGTGTGKREDGIKIVSCLQAHT
jgi:hypothetical protein